MKVACFYETGAPEDVLRIEEWDMPKIDENQVLVKWLYSPINPADINVLQGRYGNQPCLPAIGGNEAVGKVVEIGSKVTQFKVDDHLITAGRFGTWCEYSALEEKHLIKIPKSIPLEQACMLHVNPPTAWQLLHHFKKLNSGDWIIQNAANSAVGQCIIQIAKFLNINTINIVRRKELIEPLKDLGANIVLSEEDRLISTQIKEINFQHPISIGFNAVGGDSAKQIAKTLSESGQIITYGAMGKSPIQISNSLLIFKNVSYHGFWITKWFQNANKIKIDEMMNQIFNLISKNQLKLPIEKIYALEEINLALQHAIKTKRNGKILIKTND